MTRYCYDDSHVSPLSDPSDVVTPAAYVLFYVQRGAAAAPAATAAAAAAAGDTAALASLSADKLAAHEGGARARTRTHARTHQQTTAHTARPTCLCLAA